MLKPIKLTLPLLLSISLFQKASAQTIDWNYSLYCTPVFNANSSGMVFSIDLDEYGRPYYGYLEHVTVMGGHQKGYYMRDNIFGQGAGTTSSNPSYAGKIFASHFSNIYFTDDANNFALKKYKRYTFKWSIPLPTTWSGLSSYNVVEDYSENVYLNKSDSIFKYDVNANFQWAKKININCVAVDIYNNLFVAGDSIFKFDSLGNQLWYYPLDVPQIVTDIKGNCYFPFPGSDLITKIDSAGILIFTGTETVSNAFTVDTNQNIYTIQSTQVKKIDFMGNNVVWMVTMPNVFSLISADAHQNCYLLRAQNYSGAPSYGCVYYARISSLAPPDSITCSLTDTAFCPGDSIEIYFNSNPQISSASSFVAQLSDTAGNFSANPGIGLGITNSSPFRVKLPTALSPGNNYRIRVLTYPVDTNVVSVPTNYFTIYPLPVVSLLFSTDTVCVNAGPVLIIGTPAGGTFLGSYVSGNSFYPDSSGPGNFNVNYTFTDSLGCTNNKNSFIHVDACLGVNSILGNIFYIHPNPAQEEITISGLQLAVGDLLVLSDLYGKPVITQKIAAPISRDASEFKLQTSGIANGIYVLTVHMRKGSVERKVLIFK